jgi:hypothetical protein
MIMERVNFSTSINASKEKVWEALWNDASYRQWTSAFTEGSHAVTDWQQGSKILFLDGKGDGMVSTVAVNKPNEYMSIKHLGEVKKGVEDTTSAGVQSWAGAMENYSLSEAGGVTTVNVEMDMVEDFRDYFMKTWPKALEQLKAVSESNS